MITSETNKEKIIIEITNKDCKMIFQSPDGGVSIKRISPDELCRFLATKNTLMVHELPLGCIYGSSKNGKHLFVFLEREHVAPMYLYWGDKEEAKWRKRHGEMEDHIPSGEDIPGGWEDKADQIRKFMIPWPNMAIICSVNENETGFHLNSMHAYSCDNIDFSRDKIICKRLPFTNVYGDNSLCIGNVGEFVPKTLDGCSFFPSLLYNGVGNTDLTGGVNLETHGSLRYGIMRDEGDLIVHMDADTRKTFPYEYAMNISDSNSTSNLGYIIRTHETNMFGDCGNDETDEEIGEDI